MLTVLLYCGLGAFAGLIAGLFGVGGGVVIVPALIYAFARQGIDSGILTHLAVGTSLAIICVTSISSVRTHHQHGFIQWAIVKPMMPGLIVGVLLGVYGLQYISGAVLQVTIGLFLCMVAVQMGAGLVPDGRFALPANKVLTLLASMIGCVSALFGIGGGSLTVPMLSLYGIKMKQAVATSAACGIPIAFAASAANGFSGWHMTQELSYTLGYIYLPAFFCISAMSAPFARLGAVLVKKLDAQLLKRCFAVFVAIIGCSLILKSVGFS